MVFIYIRHGHDNGGDPTFLQDNKLTNTGIKGSRNLAKELILKYGRPSVIYCSPFRRTRRTLSEMVRYINDKGYKEPKIVIDKKLSRFFTDKERKKPSVSAKTLSYNPPIQEDWRHFQKRVNKHLREMNSLSTKKIVWVISHYLVLREVSTHYNITVPDRFSFLEHFIIKNH